MKNDAFEVVAGAMRRDRLGRVVLDKSRREELMAKFHASGMSQAKFCQREGVNANTFSGWRRVRVTRGSHTGEATSSLTRNGTRAPMFREVVVTEKTGVAASAITLVFPGGAEVRGCDVATAVALIKALNEAR